MADAASIWAYADAAAKLAAQQGRAGDVHLVHGLDATAPLTVAPTQRAAGSVVQDVAQAGQEVTVARA